MYTLRTSVDPEMEISAVFEGIHHGCECNKRCKKLVASKKDVKGPAECQQSANPQQTGPN